MNIHLPEFYEILKYVCIESPVRAFQVDVCLEDF